MGEQEWQFSLLLAHLSEWELYINQSLDPYSSKLKHIGMDTSLP